MEIRYDRYRPIPSGKAHKEGDLPGAGIIYDLSPHLVDQALQLFGWPQAIFGDVWRMREGVKASDYFEMLLYYPEMRVQTESNLHSTRAITFLYTTWHERKFYSAAFRSAGDTVECRSYSLTGKLVPITFTTRWAIAYGNKWRSDP